MALPKLFQRIFWHNNTTPAINEDNLNAMSKGLSDVDDRLISLAGTIMEDVPQIQQDIEDLEELAADFDTAVQTAQNAATSAQSSASNANAKALVSEGWAKGTQNGAAVGSSSPYYHNNAEYFKNQARSFTPQGYQDLVDDVDSLKETLTQQINVSDAKNLCPTMNPSDPSTSSAWSSFFKINADGSITANGTPPGRVSIASRVVLPAGQYIMKGCPSGGNWNTYRIIFLKYTPSETVVYADTGLTPTAVTLDEETEIVIRVDLYGGYTASNLVYKPMICLKSVYDLDPTFEPYAKTNQQLTQETIGLIDNQNVNGAVNMLENKLTSQVYSKATITVNSDKTISVTRSDSTGTLINLEIGTFTGLSEIRLTGCPSGGADNTYGLQLYDGTTYFYPLEKGDGLVRTCDPSLTYHVLLIIRAGVTGTWLFKPMLSVASLNLSYDDYVPYAKSNKELTEEGVRFSTKSVTVKGLGLTFQKCGNIVAVSFSGTSNEAITANAAFYSLTGAMSTGLHVDQKLVSGERMQIERANQRIVFSADIPSGTSIRGTIIYASDNFTALS